MHIMLKRTLFFLASTIITGAFISSGLSPLVSKTAEGLCLISVLMAMFFAIAYSLREEK